MTTTDIILMVMILIIIILIKIINMIEKVGEVQVTVGNELVRQNERAYETNRVCNKTNKHVHKMLVIAEYENKHRLIPSHGLECVQGSEDTKGYEHSHTDKSDESAELTLGEVCAVIMESLENCPEELKDTEAVKDSIETFTGNVNFLKTYADELIDRLNVKKIPLSEKSIRDEVISDLRLINK